MLIEMSHENTNDINALWRVAWSLLWLTESGGDSEVGNSDKGECEGEEAKEVELESKGKMMGDGEEEVEKENEEVQGKVDEVGQEAEKEKLVELGDVEGCVDVKD
ncbi:hypothetical protein P691DRAFT_769610 [Macrolepiota fuliginosa MF-IS2]|uniref:Uncharacterized protein n=1 Tax=Macrolepiota fuliginosa MF-IS2 TaxID=1400762 RepID=A0A9P5WVQ8_9AGAR|nr:hypothetical protein P691DRAFT_769610 [Macrolepiota fuliginosa MF-IS2]